MTSSFTFKPDDRGIADAVNGEGVAEHLTAIVADARTKIQRRAPHGRDAFYDYHRSIRYVPARRTPDGLEAAVGSDSPGWHLVEYGTQRFSPLAPIRRGVEEAGIELTEGQRSMASHFNDAVRAGRGSP